MSLHHDEKHNNEHLNEHLLETQLQACIAEGRYPFHMPGHKRRMAPAPDLPYTWDLTEIEGTDDLHRPEGILREAMDRTAFLYHVRTVRYLVGGSTAGILSGIRAAAPHGSGIIAARNCHRSVYHAIELGNLKVHWAWPIQVPEFGICGSIDPEEIRRLLEEQPGVRAVIVTSPTYEGVLSDIRRIAEYCHAKKVPLIVDEAHGAHLIPGLGHFPDGAAACGADLVIQSPHKTLPSLTQSAWILNNSDLIPQSALDRQLDVFETSSPSYPLMASLDGCTGILQSRGAALYEAYEEALDRFDEKAAALSHLKVLGYGKDRNVRRPGIYALDRGKILINGDGAGHTGASLAGILREKYRMETEMSLGGNVLAMTSLCDDPSAIARLAEALLEIDRNAAGPEETCKAAGQTDVLPRPEEAPLSIAAACDAPSVIADAKEAEGRISTEYVYCYPPGIPLIAPGERISREQIETLSELSDKGMRIRHTVSSREDGFAVMEK